MTICANASSPSQLPPDTTLSRTELTATYEVSQAPIREAMQLLKQEGQVRIYPRSRTVVTRIDIPQIYEAHFLRVALETEVCRRLSADPDPAAVTRARSIIKMQQAGRTTRISCRSSGNWTSSFTRHRLPASSAADCIS